ncbi:class I SAM-dependent methyltransferase [Aeoliella sp. SH292]|uniref:class I SAM-dependent methyltransferase n=1 Tax=Aeoliella sp. SH292 TaxID=3454464 RepID=UPI003F993E5D
MGAFESQNARAWDNLARDGAPLARPATDADFANPLATIDPAKWLGSSITGWRVLCLAAGGGRQSALYAAAGAHVTVLDISREMLALDAEVARERKLNVRIVEGTMTDLSMFAAGEFDLVIQPVSTCYVPNVVSVYQQVARVVRGGGLYVSQHKSPVSLQVAAKRQAVGYVIEETYYRTGPLAPAEPSRLRERGATEYLHRWEELIGGMCRAGFVVEDLLEPMHAKPDAEPGMFAHRAKYIAPYVRIKARRAGVERNLFR